ncbi:3',5'-cyclic-nucleotide phosphodiesterase [Pelobium sp.]|nr:3',5'-cyclic-nucleotide phosphodiesterase [Pelobium sp.]MDA9555416.1 3',5'-cyclic-nucleotide phosphodiesterase [Pelobium sp.]
MFKKLYFTALIICSFLSVNAQTVFKVVPLGVLGGSDESNLSAYMLAPKNSSHYVCLDAGTLKAGINKAVNKKIFRSTAEQILKDSIKGYLISHGHLDHLAGLVLNSPDDSAKPIYAANYVLDVFKKHYFSWDSWANFGSEGEKPILSKYQYVSLTPGKEQVLQNTEMYVNAFPLSHSEPYQSTAFLVRYQQNYLLYLGDTGSDSIEKSQKLDSLWRFIAPMIQSKALKAIFIETSFPNSQPDKSLFGHLTPKLLMQEMAHLSKYTGEAALKNFNLVVTHVKPNGNHIQEIKTEIKDLNTLKFNLIFPEQGQKLLF